MMTWSPVLGKMMLRRRHVMICLEVPDLGSGGSSSLLTFHKAGVLEDDVVASLVGAHKEVHRKSGWVHCEFSMFQSMHLDVLIVRENCCSGFSWFGWAMDEHVNGSIYTC